jgi:hypothetical protein
MGTGPNASGVNQRFLAGLDREKTENVSQQGGYANDDMEDELDIQRGARADNYGADIDISSSKNDEIGVPQNISNEDLNNNKDLPGSDLDEAQNSKK